MNRIFVFFLFLLSSICSAQNPDWQTLTNMNNVLDMVVYDQKVWAVSDGGAYIFNPSDESIEKITNINGLRSVNLRAIATDNYGNVIFGSAEGFIQTYNYTKDTWSNIRFDGTDIKDFFVVDDTLWVAAGSGVAVFLWRNNTWEYSDFFINFPEIVQTINTLIVFNNRIWLGTNIGLISAPSDFAANTLTDPENWLLQTTQQNLPGNVILSFSEHDGMLWIGTASGLAYLSGNSIQIVSTYGPNPIVGLASGHQDLIVLREKAFFEFNLNDGIVKQLDFSNTLNTVIVDASGEIWIAVNKNGLVNSESNKTIFIDGPAFNNIRFVIKDASQRIWASSGKFRLTPNEGYSVFQDDAWWSVDFLSAGWSDLGNTTYIYEDNFNNIWLATWGGGVEVLKGDEFLYFHNYQNEGIRVLTEGGISMNQTISPVDAQYRGFFTGVPSNSSYEVITYFKQDFYGNLWIVNSESNTEEYIAVAPYINGFVDLNKSNWVYFDDEDGLNASTGIMCLEFDDFGRAWVGTDRNGVYVLDYKNTLNTKADDQIFHLDLNDNLYSNSIKTIAKDNDGIIWLGSNGGLNSYDGANLFKHVGDERGLDGPLNTIINQIVVDEFNNKWIATAGGISILRAGKSPFEPGAWIGYTTQNSGLVSDNVHSIFVDKNTSQAIIGTENGLSIFSGPFAEIQDEFDEVIAGPNPFVLSENNIFTIKKLRDNSTVKIFDLSGTLVRKLQTKDKLIDGSRAFWDGHDSNGHPVASGIYLYIAYTEDGSSFSGKVAVIKK